MFCAIVILKRAWRLVKWNVSDSFVSFAGRVTGYAMSQLRQCSTRRAPCVPASLTSVGAQYRYQTDTSTFLVWAHHTGAAGPALAVVSGTHWLQAGYAHLLMPARSGTIVSFWLHPVRHRFQSPPPSVVVFLTASDLTHTAVLHYRRSCVSGAWKLPLQQFATCHHLSSNAYCFSEPPHDLPFTRSFPS